MAAQRLGKRVLSKLQAPSRARGPGGSPGGLQKRHARVTVKYDRRELQRRLDVEKWIDGRLEELYRGRVRQGGPWRRWGSTGYRSLGSLVACAGCCTRTPRGQALIALIHRRWHSACGHRDTYLNHLRCAQTSGEGQGFTIWGVKRQSWGARAAISGERVGGGDVLKPNIDMVTGE